MSYKDNFDEFGNLRHDHSKWTWPDRIVLAIFVGILALAVIK